MKTTEQQRARELRGRGQSVKEIARELHVSQSSVSRWIRDVPLTEEQRRRLLARISQGRLDGAVKLIRAARRQRAEYQERGRELARERDASYAAGCMLFWAEGDKRRNGVALANSDPELLAFFVSFLRRHFAVQDHEFSVYCNLFADHIARQTEIERFWLSTLHLPPTCLRKSTINTYSKYSAKKRTNKLPNGTCKLVVHRTWIVQTIYGSIQEYGGFERPAWLD